MSGMFRFTAPSCRTGTCGCPGKVHTLYRSRSCYQGLCDHANQGLPCGIARPEPAPKGDEK